jgi:hypothetical protein
VDNSSGKSWTEYLRLITPFLLLVVTGYCSFISSKLTEIDDKLFKHLTNDELHAPRSLVVTKPEFLIYQTMRDKQMEDIKNAVLDMRCALEGNPVRRR